MAHCEMSSDSEEEQSVSSQDDVPEEVPLQQLKSAHQDQLKEQKLSALK